MNRRTRDLITSGTDQSNLTSGNAVWETPPAVFAALHAQYRFDIDLFADAERALLPVWFGPGSEFEADALAVSWHEYGECGFWNPPYGRFLRRVIDKAISEAQHGFRSVGLIPMRWTRPLRKLVFESGVCSAVLIPDKRITFYENGKPRLGYDKRTKTWKPMPALFDSVIVEVGPAPSPWSATPVTPALAEWSVPKH